MRVAVVGAGFSGLMFATALARAGANVEVFEEHNKVGFPEHCTGLVSERTAEIIGRPAEGSRIGTIGSFLISGPRNSMRIRASSPVVKLDRVKLEELMKEEAEDEGVRFRFGSRARVTPEGHVLPEGRSYDAVILAEGYMGALRGILGIGFTGEPVYGVNVEFDSGGPADFEARFDRATSDGFFSWRVLVGSITIVGTAARDPRVLSVKLTKAVRLHGAEGRILKYYGGPIIVGPYPRRVRSGRVVVVGDAASMNKPLTGGGLYPSAVASLRAEALVREGVSVADAVERSVLETLRELRQTYHTSRLLHERPEVVDLIVEAAASTGLADRLSGMIDYDRHHEIIGLSVRTKEFYASALRVFLRDPVASLRLLVSGLADIV